ncbi:MAG TPA: YggU family protein [Methanomicrobia archaeon]|nr:YggU family protein [Methanomicrobia archaeon]
MYSKAISETGDGVLIDVMVVPNSKETAMEWDPWRSRVRVKVRARPAKGKANEEVVEVFSSVGPSRIIRGHRSREKTVLIEASPDEVTSFLASYLQKS